MSVKEAVEEIKNLNAIEKLEIVGEIWDSIAINNSDIPVSEKHKRILDSRLAEHQKNLDTHLSLGEFKGKLADAIQAHSQKESSQ